MIHTGTASLAVSSAARISLRQRGAYFPWPLPSFLRASTKRCSARSCRSPNPRASSNQALALTTCSVIRRRRRVRSSRRCCRSATDGPARLSRSQVSAVRQCQAAARSAGSLAAAGPLAVISRAQRGAAAAKRGHRSAKRPACGCSSARRATSARTSSQRTQSCVASASARSAHEPAAPSRSRPASRRPPSACRCATRSPARRRAVAASITAIRRAISSSSGWGAEAIPNAANPSGATATGWRSNRAASPDR